MDRTYQPISLAQLESVSFGDKDFKIELIEIFLEQIPAFIKNMQSFLDLQKLPELAKEAHTAKSSVLIFAMEETGEALKNIQLQAEKRQTEQLADLVEKSVFEMRAAADQLSSILNTLK